MKTRIVQLLCCAALSLGFVSCAGMNSAAFQNALAGQYQVQGDVAYQEDPQASLEAWGQAMDQITAIAQQLQALR